MMRVREAPSYFARAWLSSWVMLGRGQHCSRSSKSSAGIRLDLPPRMELYLGVATWLRNPNLDDGMLSFDPAANTPGCMRPITMAEPGCRKRGSVH